MKIVIVGAGVCGLTLGYLLSQHGCRVTILECETRIGGLARSFNYNGWSIDIGPHRFHTDDPLVHGLIQEVMGDNLIVIPRKSKVFFCNRHFDWPLNLSSIFKLPLTLKLKACRDLLLRPPIVNESYEAYVLSKYGKTLTEHFFREYNQKFLKIDLRECHRDWAETGINRATIDKDVKSASIVDLLLGILSTRRVNTTFLYPKDGPIERFCYRLLRLIENNGGNVVCGVNLKNAYVEKGNLTRLKAADEREWEADFVFWTGAPDDLEQMLGFAPSSLHYCSTIVCNLLVEGHPPVPAQWEYFGSRDYVFCRTSINIYFNECLAPQGFYGVCAELVCYKNDFVWRRAETLINTIVQNLIHANIIKNFNSIIEVHFEQIKNTYPIYRLDYRSHIQSYNSRISQIHNLVACGRTGGFWYNNMDHSIRAAIDLARCMTDVGFKTRRPENIQAVYRGDF